MVRTDLSIYPDSSYCALPVLPIIFEQRETRPRTTWGRLPSSSEPTSMPEVLLDDQDSTCGREFVRLPVAEPDDLQADRAARARVESKGLRPDSPRGASDRAEDPALVIFLRRGRFSPL